jgi:hypothetical protein
MAPAPEASFLKFYNSHTPFKPMQLFDAPVSRISFPTPLIFALSIDVVFLHNF